MTVRVNRGTSQSQYAHWSMANDIARGGLKVAECPGCEGNIALSKGVKLGERIDCPECGEKLEVISLRPLELDYAFDDEDWEDSGDEDSEEEWEEEEV